MALDLLIFDFDGVLSDSESLSCRSLMITLAELGIHMTEAEVDARFTGMGTQNMIADIEAKDGIKVPADFQDRNWTIVQDMMHQELQAVPFAREMLAALPPDLPKCIASNSFKEWIDLALDITGLDMFFDEHVRFNADMVAAPKPAPYLHQHALQAMGGVDPKQALIIEDTVTGLGGGIANGIEVWGCLAVSPHVEESRQNLLKAGASLVFDDLRDLPSLINQRYA